MTSSEFDFEHLLMLLGRSENDSEVEMFLGDAKSKIKRDEYYGTLEFRHQGVGVVFQEATWVIPPEQVRDPKELYLAAFHFHSPGHEGFMGYSGQFPNSLAFGDSEAEVVHKMGKPVRIGGGEMSRLLGGIPRWFWYPLGRTILHVQFNPKLCTEMITIRLPEIKRTEAGGSP